MTAVKKDSAYQRLHKGVILLCLAAYGHAMEERGEISSTDADPGITVDYDRDKQRMTVTLHPDPEQGVMKKDHLVVDLTSSSKEAFLNIPTLPWSSFSKRLLHFVSQDFLFQADNLKLAGKKC